MEEKKAAAQRPQKVPHKKPVSPKTAPQKPTPKKPTPKKPAPKRLTPQQIKNRRIFFAGVVALLLVVVIVAVSVASCNRTPAGPAEPDFGEAAGAWAKNANGFYFNDEGNVIAPAVLKGIDVSKYQGEVDWQKAKDAGIDFAIIRCGFGSEWNGEGSYAQDDEQWERNADACTALGIPFGTYLYSYATTEEQAQLEADHVARLLGLRAPQHEGLTDYTAKAYKLDYPVYYDLEDKKISGLFPEEMAALTKAFFMRLESYGYTGAQGIYASLNWTRARLQDEAFDEWRDNFWIARFSPELNYTGPYAMWQASYTEPGAGYGVQSDTIDVDFVMEELRLTGLADSESASFTNDTYKNELAMAAKGSKATLLTDEPTEADGGQKLYWQSSDPTVAKVDKHGTVKAVTKTNGSCTVTGTLADGRQSVSVTVRVGTIQIPVFVTANLRGENASGTISLADVVALKAANPDAILLDAGGSMQGSLSASMTGGMDMTSALAAADYDLQCFDGPDLAYGPERLLEVSLAADGPSLAANLRSAEGTPLFYRGTSWNRNRITNGMNYVIQQAGKKIGFFALSSAGNYVHAADLTVNDMAQTAAEQVAALQAQGADAILCIVGPGTDASAVYQNLADLGVWAVLDAHATEVPAGAGLTVVPVGTGFDSVTRVDVTFDGSSAKLLTPTVISANEIKAMRAEYTPEQTESYDAAAAALQTLDAGDTDVANSELFTLAENTDGKKTVSFGNYVASVYEALADGDRERWPAEQTADLSLWAVAGGVTEFESTGTITRGELLHALPGGTRLQLVQTTNAAVKTLIESGAVSETYINSLKEFEATEGNCLLMTDTATLKLLADQSYTVLRDYGDVFWNIRMNINDVTENYANDFTLPEAPTIGVGRGDVLS